MECICGVRRASRSVILLQQCFASVYLIYTLCTDIDVTSYLLTVTVNHIENYDSASGIWFVWFFGYLACDISVNFVNVFM